jgi:two-component system, OmpR family, response regulator
MAETRDVRGVEWVLLYSLTRRHKRAAAGNTRRRAPPENPEGTSMRNLSIISTRVHVWTASRSAVHSTPPRVLIVDDYIDSADALTAFLDHTGFAARAAYNGCDALKVANEWRPDSIVLDIAMPGLSGLAVAKTLRETPETASVPLLAYTACEPESDYDELRAGGFDAVCAKPMDPLMIVKILTMLLGTAAMSRAYAAR